MFSEIKCKLVSKLKCDCKERNEIEINSVKLFNELNEFFSNQVEKGLFSEIEVLSPYYSGYSVLKRKVIDWHATKWYKCNECGCLWEIKYPDFPAKGFVRKFIDGVYYSKDLE